MPEIEVDHVEEIQRRGSAAPKRDIFGGGDPVGTLVEHGGGGKHHTSEEPLTAYQRGQSGIPNFVGPAPRKPGVVRRILRWMRGEA